MQSGGVKADVATPRETDEGSALDAELVEEVRDEVRERMRVVARRLELGRPAEPGRVEREDADAVVVGERRARGVERGAAAGAEADAVPVEGVPAGRLAQDMNGEPGAAGLDAALGAEIHRP